MATDKTTRAAYMREYRKRNPDKQRVQDKNNAAAKKARDPEKYKAAMRARSRKAYENKKANPPPPMTPEELADFRRRRAEANRKWREKAGEVQKQKERERANRQYHSNREKAYALQAGRQEAVESGGLTAEQWRRIRRRTGTPASTASGR